MYMKGYHEELQLLI